MQTDAHAPHPWSWRFTGIHSFSAYQSLTMAPIAAQGLSFVQSSRPGLHARSMPFEFVLTPFSLRGKRIYFHHHPHSKLPATKAEVWSNSLNHQLEAWALNTATHRVKNMSSL